jgi:hypothetical protein
MCSSIGATKPAYLYLHTSVDCHGVLFFWLPCLLGEGWSLSAIYIVLLMSMGCSCQEFVIRMHFTTDISVTWWLGIHIFWWPKQKKQNHSDILYDKPLTYQCFHLIFYRFCSKQACLSKLVCLWQAI